VAGENKTRLRWFRAIALLSPLLLLVLVEAGLRLMNSGYSTGFFIKTNRGEPGVLVENPKFGWRFFPPSVARSPQPLRLTMPKPPDTIRVFVFGESAAMGDPEPAYGFARQLERMLQVRHADKKIEVINVAMTGINSHVICEIARDCGPLEGDCWLIYAGNNEVVGPFGAGTVFGRQTPNRWVIRANLALKSLRLGQLVLKWLSRSHEPIEWEGMEMFLRQQVRSNDPRLETVYGHFERNIGEIIDRGRNAGAKVIVATMAVNLKDCPPFASVHRAGLDATQLSEWERQFAAGRQSERAERFGDAAVAYEKAWRIDPEFAEVAFHRACCDFAQNKYTAAETNFCRARDLDALRFRADSAINGRIRRVAAQKQVRLIDAEQECAVGSTSVPGEEIFYDHVHLNFKGNHRVAALFLPGVEKELFGSVFGSALSEEETGRRLAFTPFDEGRVGEEMRLRLRQPPFSSQSNAEERDVRWEKRLEQLRGALADSVGAYRAALALAPEDWVLHANLGRLLEATEDAPEATTEWQQVIRLMPDEPDGWFQLGELAYGGKKYVEADSYYRKTLEKKPDSCEALNGLGLSAAAQGKSREAFQYFETALRVNPRFSVARVNRGLLLAKTGDTAGAIAEYRAVIRTDTNNVAARINLGKLLAGQNRTDEAVALYSEAVQVKPNDPIVQYDLANALAAQRHYDQAVAHYTAAVKLKPDFVDARYNLAVELARTGKISEALDQFFLVVKERPDSVEARFNYGIALAKQQRYSDATTQFREVLRLQPDYAPARAALERALRLSDGGH